MTWQCETSAYGWVPQQVIQSGVNNYYSFADEEKAMQKKQERFVFFFHQNWTNSFFNWTEATNCYLTFTDFSDTSAATYKEV